MTATGSTSSRLALAWRNDVALEIWVDGSGLSIGIRLSGTLDHVTATNLVSLVIELIEEGGRRFSLDIHGLYVADGTGHAALSEVRRLIQSAGGCLSWQEDTQVG
jgi:ABC-type transporter Mla MlaB component